MDIVRFYYCEILCIDDVMKNKIEVIIIVTASDYAVQIKRYVNNSVDTVLPMINVRSS